MCLKPLMLPVKFPCILAISSSKLFADYVHTSSAHTSQLKACDLKSKHEIIRVIYDRVGYSKLARIGMCVSLLFPPLKPSPVPVSVFIRSVRIRGLPYWRQSPLEQHEAFVSQRESLPMGKIRPRIFQQCGQVIITLPPYRFCAYAFIMKGFSIFDS